MRQCETGPKGKTNKRTRGNKGREVDRPEHDEKHGQEQDEKRVGGLSLHSTIRRARDGIRRRKESTKAAEEPGASLMPNHTLVWCGRGRQDRGSGWEEKTSRR